MILIGTLTKNHQGRYTLPDGHYFTTGDDIEIKLELTWIKTKVHHDLKDYYLVDYPSVSMEGLMARKP